MNKTVQIEGVERGQGAFTPLVGALEAHVKALSAQCDLLRSQRDALLQQLVRLLNLASDPRDDDEIELDMKAELCRCTALIDLIAPVWVMH